MGLPNNIGLPNTLFTSDLHFTAKPEDAYRWELFPWLASKIDEYSLEWIIIPGDITDAKDNHPAVLVNRLVDELAALSKCVNVLMVMGNHDCIDPDYPFLGFLNYIPGLYFQSAGPCTYEIGNAVIGVMPHTENPEQKWQKARKHLFKKWDLGIMHHTVEGSLISNGERLHGTTTKYFEGCPFISGDVHVPQQRSTITYVGSPYHVHFGDRFTPRVLVYHKGRWKEDHFPSLRRESLRLRNPEQLLGQDLRPGDQVKIKLELPKAELHNWKEHKRRVHDICRELDVELFGVELRQRQKHSLKKRPTKTEDEAPQPAISKVTGEQVFHEYCQQQKLDRPTVETGKSILKEVE